MEQLNKYFIFGGVGLIIVIIAVMTGFKVYSNHMDRVYLVFNASIEEAAIECYLDNVCSKELLISELEDNLYIEKVIDPETKKHLGDVSVSISNYKATINY